MKFNTLETNRIVYGGGGIMPDVFIPVDTTKYTMYHRKVVASGVINRAAMNYEDKYRDKLKKEYKKFSKYNEEFEVGEEILQDMKSMAEKEKIEFKEEEYNKSLALIKLQIKALIARDLYDMTEYFQIINNASDSYNEALKIINDDEIYNRILGRGK